MAVVGKPLINGIEYTHADVIINIFGVPVVGVTAIDYKDPQDITLNYGTGQHPNSRGFGAIKPEATITMTSKEVQRLSNAALDGRIQNLPAVDIGVNFGTEALDFQRHVLVQARFKGRNPNSAVNNSQIEEQLELSVVEIKYKGA